MLDFRSSLVLATLALAAPALADTSEDATSFADAMASESNEVVFHKLIEFAPASTQVSTADRVLLERMARTWVGSGQQTFIKVHGYSDSLDLGIAERRAEIIRGYLIKSGVAPARVIAIGHTLDTEGRRIDLSIGSCTGGQCAPKNHLDPRPIATTTTDATVSNPQPGLHLGADRRPSIDDPTTVSAQPTKSVDTTTSDRITLRPMPAIGAGTVLTPQNVLDRINTVYMPNLQRCYKKGQRANAALAGKITLSFTVTGRGTLDNILAKGVSVEVERCVSNMMTAWKFAIPRGPDGDPTDQSLRLVLAAK